MFGQVARAARPAVAAAAAAAAAQGSVHARAPPASAQGAARQTAISKIVDRDTEGWLLAELQDEVVVFKPYDKEEVDDAANVVMSLWGGRYASSSAAPGPFITEPADEADEAAPSSSASSSCGDGLLADAVIEAAAAASAGALAGGNHKERVELENLMAITTRMLRRPGMQREVVACMLEDVEVRQLMLRQCNDLDRYLLAAGIHTPHLLPAPEGPADVGADADSEAQPEGPNLVSRLVGVVAGALEKAGDALASLGGWLRRHVAFMFPPEGAEREAEASGEGAAPGGKRADQLLGGVMALAVAVFCVAIIRRPLVMRMSRR